MMKWSEMCVHTTNEAVEPISNILHEYGASGVVITDPLDMAKDRDTSFGEIYELNPDDYPAEGVFVKAYLPVNQSLTQTITKVKEAVSNLTLYGIDIGKNQVTFREIDEIDWSTAWKKYYKPVNISNMITIIPTWEDYTPRADEMIIELDPGMAFGTGTHSTTILSIQALERHLYPDDTVIDVGCGSGVLSIASALLGAKKVHAFDLDDVAVKSTQINVGLNQLDDRVIAEQSDLLNQVQVKADLIVSNILAEIIVRFVKDAWDNLIQGGLFITSGIIQSKKEDVIEALKEQGFYIEETDKMGEWVCIIAKKP